MAHYLIEFRFFGATKFEIRRLIYDVDRRFRLGRVWGRHPVPHVTLVGPFRTRNERQLVKDFIRICEEAKLMDMHIKGYGTFDETRVVHININPSIDLDNFRWQLSRKISPYCDLTSYDNEQSFSFHATIAMKIPWQKFNSIKGFVKRQPAINKGYTLSRVTLLRNAKILCEYDFLQRRVLNRKEALSKSTRMVTADLLQQHFEHGGSNLQNGSHSPINAVDSPQEEEKWIEIPIQTLAKDVTIPKKSLFKKVKEVLVFV